MLEVLLDDAASEGAHCEHAQGREGVLCESEPFQAVLNTDFGDSVYRGWLSRSVCEA